MKTSSEKENEMGDALSRRKVCENIGESSTVSPPNYEAALDEIRKLFDSCPTPGKPASEVLGELGRAVDDILKAVNK